jgi:hypothetical protein
MPAMLCADRAVSLRTAQRRLAGTVVADQGDHLAGVDVKGEILNRDDTAKDLADALEADGSAPRAVAL